MAEKLKPCPFCGGTDIEVQRAGTSRQSCIVACEQGGALIESTEIGYGGSWNDRAEPEEHVLGVGHLRIVTDWPGKKARMVGISEPDTGQLSDLDCKPVMCGRYRLILEKVTL